MASVQKGRISPPLPTPPPKKRWGGGGRGKILLSSALEKGGGGGEEAFWARGQEKNEEEEEDENSIPLKLSSNRTAHKRGRQGGGGEVRKFGKLGQMIPRRARGAERGKKKCVAARRSVVFSDFPRARIFGKFGQPASDLQSKENLQMKRKLCAKGILATLFSSSS